MVNAREMLLIISAQNRASGALASVGRDLSALSKAQKAQIVDQKLAIQMTRLQNQQLAAQSKLKNLTTGSNAISLQQKRNQLINDEAKAQKALTANLLEQQGVRQKLAAASKVAAYNPGGLQATQIAPLQAKLATLTKTEADLNKQQLLLADSSKKLAASETLLAEQTAAASRELSLIGTRINLLKDQQAALRKEVAAMRWDSLLAGGAFATHIARPMQYAGIAVGAALGYAAKQAADFNTQVGLAATQVSVKFTAGAAATQRAASQLSKGIISILKSGQAEAGSADQTSAAYDIYSSMTLKGSQASQVKQGLALLKEVNKAAIAGQTDLPDVTNAAVTVLNDFGKTGQQVKDLPDLLNRMFSAVKYGRTTFAQFVATLNQTAPAFKSAGLSFNDLASSTAALTRDMPSSRMAGTALARLVQMLSNKDFIAGLQKSGVSITHLNSVGGQALDPLLTIIEKINDKFPKLKAGGTDLTNFFKEITALGSGTKGTTGTIQGNRALQLLLLDLKNYQTVAPQVINDNGEFARSFQVLQDTSGVKWKEFTQQIRAFVLEIGEYAIPVLIKLAKPLEDAVKWFDSLSQSTQKSIAKWGLYAAAGLLLGSSILYIVGNTVKIVAIFGKLGILLPSLIAGFIAYKLASAALAGNLNNLTDVVNTLLGIFTQNGVWGWIGYFAVAAYGVVKLTSALKVMRGTMVSIGLIGGAEGSAGGITGVLSKLTKSGGAATGGIVAGSVVGEGEVGAGGAVAGLGMVGTLGIGAAIIAAGAAGLLLWDKHMQSVKQHAAEVNSVLQQMNNIIKSEATQTTKLGQVGNNVETAIRSSDAYKAAQRVLAGDKKTHQPASVITEDQLNVRDAGQQVAKANSAQTQSFKAFNNALKDHAALLQKVAQYSKLLTVGSKTHMVTQRGAPSNSLTLGSTILNKIGLGRINGTTQVPTTALNSQDLNDLKKFLSSAEGAVAQSSTKIQKSLAKAFASLGGLPGLPRKLSSSTISDATALAFSSGKMPSIAQVKEIVKAEADPAYLRKLSGAIHAAVVSGEITRASDARTQAAIKQSLKITPITDSTYVGLHKSIQSKLTPVNEAIKLGPINPSAVRAGAEIDAGIASGITSNAGIVNQAAINVAQGAIDAARSKKGTDAKSPSKKGIIIGKEIVQGISLGFLENQGILTTPVSDTISSVFSTLTTQTAQALNIFGSTTLGNRLTAIDDAKKATPLQIARAQHSVTIAQVAVAKKHGDTIANQQRLTIAQKALTTDLNKGKVKPLNANDLQKDVNSQLSDLTRFNDGIKKLTAEHAPRDMVNQLIALGTTGVKEIEVLANETPVQLAKYEKAFQAANSATAKFSQVTPQLVNASLKTQVTAYTNFNHQLALLLSKGVPAAYVDQLRAAGTDSEKQLVAMNSMTATQLAQNVALWKKYEAQTKIAAKASTADIVAAQQQEISTIAQFLEQTYQNFQQQETSAFGSILSGPNSGLPTGIQGILNQNQNQTSNLTSQLGSLFQGLSPNTDNLMTNLQTKLQYGATLSPTDLQNALQDQVTDFQGYNQDIVDLTNKGVPQALIDQFESLGPSYKQFLDTLDQETPTQLGNYVNTFQQGQQDITQFSTALQQAIDPQTIIDDLSQQTNAFNAWQADLQQLRDDGLPEALIQQLEALGPGADDALQGLLKATGPQLTTYANLFGAAQDSINIASINDFNAQLTAWYNQGGNLAQEIIDGTVGMTPTVVAAFTSLADSISQGFHAHLDLSIPPVTVSTGDGGTTTTPGTGSTTTTPTTAPPGYKWILTNDGWDLQPIPGYVPPASSSSGSGSFPAPPNAYGPGGPSQLHAAGGPVTGVYDGKDSVSMMAEPGEYVLTRSDVQDIKKRLGEGNSGGDSIQMIVHANQNESLQATMNKAYFRIRTSRGRSTGKS